MPRKAKEKIDEVEEIKSKAVKAPKTKASTLKKSTANTTTTTKKNTSKKADSKKATTKKEDKKTAKKKSTAKTNTKEEKNTVKSTKKISTKKTTSKKTTKSTTKKSPSKKIEVIEYYDLPYRYNQTVVRLLAQTPNTLFVYWDISDKDKEEYIKYFGEYFFNNTKPVLIIHNKTKNYSFEVEVNDFANSWYLHVADSNCDYQIELGRRPINTYVNIPNNYLYVTASNNMTTQNDHILFEKLSNSVYFRNVKTNESFTKEISNFSLLQRIGKFDINAIKEFYKKLYPNEEINFERLDLRNPSSSSTFK